LWWINSALHKDQEASVTRHSRSWERYCPPLTPHLRGHYNWVCASSPPTVTSAALGSAPIPWTGASPTGAQANFQANFGHFNSNNNTTPLPLGSFSYASNSNNQTRPLSPGSFGPNSNTSYITAPLPPGTSSNTNYVTAPLPSGISSNTNYVTAPLPPDSLDPNSNTNYMTATSISHSSTISTPGTPPSLASLPPRPTGSNSNLLLSSGGSSKGSPLSSRQIKSDYVPPPTSDP
jgi:hypothetical protein